MDDEKIVGLFFARSETAISELAGKYGGAVASVAKNLLGDRRDVEECVNDTYLSVWNSIPPEKPHQLLAYCCRIARNIAVDRLRRITAKKRKNYDRALDELEDTLAADGGVDDALDAETLAGKINAFLGRIDTEARVMFVRRYYYCDDVKDIAKRLDVTPNTVSVKLRRVRERLKKYLCEEGYEL